VDWLVTRYNLALAQAVLYDATEMRIRVWDHFGTVFSYVKLFGLMHRIYPIDSDGERVANTDQTAGYEGRTGRPGIAILKVAEVRDSHGELPAGIALCDRWEMVGEILVDETTGETRQFALDPTEDPIHTTAGDDQFDSDVERTLADKMGASEYGLEVGAGRRCLRPRC